MLVDVMHIKCMSQVENLNLTHLSPLTNKHTVSVTHSDRFLFFFNYKCL